MKYPQTEVGNILLHTMSVEDYAMLEQHFERIEFPNRLKLHRAGREIEKVYFPKDGIVSVVAMTLEGKSCDAGLFGREGMSETSTVLGTDHSPLDTSVQARGTSALKLPISALKNAMAGSGTLRLHLLKYVQAMVIQLSTTIAAANQTLEQRLARWLLMCHDRVVDDYLSLTHEFIANMLGVRRAGVTVALAGMGEMHMIEAKRGGMFIVNRPALEHSAGGGYGLAEAEYVRLIGVALRRHPTDPRRISIKGRSTACPR